jgi:hypothetical protein
VGEEAISQAGTEEKSPEENTVDLPRVEITEGVESKNEFFDIYLGTGIKESQKNQEEAHQEAPEQAKGTRNGEIPGNCPMQERVSSRAICPRVCCFREDGGEVLC